MERSDDADTASQMAGELSMQDASSLHSIQATIEESYYTSEAHESSSTTASAGLGNESSDDSSEADDRELSWRFDCLSDWTIVVADKETTLQQTYHVHKSVLSFGPRRSNYFAMVFLNKQPKQSPTAQSPNSSIDGLEEGTCHCFNPPFMAGERIESFENDSEATPPPVITISKLELSPLAAHAFPAMLDYIYSSTGRLNISSENATALHHLSQHLEIKSLRRKVRHFCKADLSLDNICTYVQHAKLFNDQKILRYAEQYYSRHIFQMREDTAVDILKTFDPPSFLRVVTSPAVGSGDSISLSLSLIISVYCSIHKHLLGRTLFRQMTASSHLPKLEVKSAKALLEIEYDIGGPDSINDESSLKRRCIPVLSENWIHLCMTEEQVMAGGTEVEEAGGFNGVSLPPLHGKHLEQFTSLALLNAKERLDRMETKYKALQLRCEILQQELEASKTRVNALVPNPTQVEPTPNAIDTAALKPTSVTPTSDILSELLDCSNE